MKTLTYSIKINQPQDLVFNKMLDKSVYNDWAKAFSAGSTFEIEGEWKQGAEVLYVDLDKGGTRVTLEVFEPGKRILAKHIGMVDAEGENSDLDETMKKWIGTLEEYEFINDNGSTNLQITMQTDEMFQEMFDESWPSALKLFKEVCEANQD